MMSSMNSSGARASPTPESPCLARRARHQARHSRWSPRADRHSCGSRSAGPLPGTAQAMARARPSTGSKPSRSAQRACPSGPRNCANSCSRTAPAMPGSVSAAANSSKSTSSLAAANSAGPSSRCASVIWGLGWEGGTTTGTGEPERPPAAALALATLPFPGLDTAAATDGRLGVASAPGCSEVRADAGPACPPAVRMGFCGLGLVTAAVVAGAGADGALGAVAAAVVKPAWKRGV
mmetsp:Transcript_55526/g.178141  ORF Transcript_55526/g.178141 Transcript_55526/m.178141 type:complete len:236 (-) Transcript_55526:693-1400(-)